MSHRGATVLIEEGSVIADGLGRKNIQSDGMDSIVPKLKCLTPGTVIPKPQAESALIYLIPTSAGFSRSLV